MGFATETDDAEWTPDIDLRMWPTPGAPDSLSIHYDDGEHAVDRTVPLGTPQTGVLTVGVNIVSWDTGRGVDISFGADCTQRLERGGGGGAGR